MEWQAQHLFHRSRLFKRRRAMPAALRRADHLPVGRAITRPVKTRSIDERLQPINRMRVNPLPILWNEFCHAAEKMRSQMFYTNPRQNQKARVVSQQMHV